MWTSVGETRESGRVVLKKHVVLWTLAEAIGTKGWWNGYEQRTRRLGDSLPSTDVSGVQRVKKHKSSARKSRTTAGSEVIGQPVMRIT